MKVQSKNEKFVLANRTFIHDVTTDGGGENYFDGIKVVSNIIFHVLFISFSYSGTYYKALFKKLVDFVCLLLFLSLRNVPSSLTHITKYKEKAELLCNRFQNTRTR